MTSSAGRTPRLAIFDGHGIIHRAYYALKDNPLVVKRTGEATSAVFGFTNTLLAVIDDLKPTHIVVAMDLPGPKVGQASSLPAKRAKANGMPRRPSASPQRAGETPALHCDGKPLFAFEHALGR